MGDAHADLEGIKAIPVGGLHERAVPESISINDFHKLIGLRQQRVGELLRYPGESKLEVENLGSAILGLFPMGDYLIIQTNSALVRAKLSEVFPDFPITAPELFPDLYDPVGPTPVAKNPELMSYALVNYQLASGTPPTATVANIWNTVPINVEEADSANRVSIAGNVITISAGAYPAFVRITGEVCLRDPQAGQSGANANQRAQLRFRNNTTSAIVAKGTEYRSSSPGSSNEERSVPHVHIRGRFQIAAATDFRLECFTSEATAFGIELGTGQPEKFAQLEILVEE